MATAINRLAGKTVRLAAGGGTRKITPKMVEAALKEIYKVSGCLSCGLIGFDIHILGGDPDPFGGEIEGFNASIR